MRAFKTIRYKVLYSLLILYLTALPNLLGATSTKDMLKPGKGEFILMPTRESMDQNLMKIKHLKDKSGVDKIQYTICNFVTRVCGKPIKIPKENLKELIINAISIVSDEMSGAQLRTNFFGALTVLNTIGAVASLKANRIGLGAVNAGLGYVNATETMAAADKEALLTKTMGELSLAQWTTEPKQSSVFYQTGTQFPIAELFRNLEAMKLKVEQLEAYDRTLQTLQPPPPPDHDMSSDKKKKDDSTFSVELKKACSSVKKRFKDFSPDDMYNRTIDQINEKYPGISEIYKYVFDLRLCGFRPEIIGLSFNERLNIFCPKLQEKFPKFSKDLALIEKEYQGLSSLTREYGLGLFDSRQCKRKHSSSGSGSTAPEENRNLNILDMKAD